MVRKKAKTIGKPKMNKDVQFVRELIRYFKASICGTAESVKILAEIEEKFPGSYKKLRDTKVDPSQIDMLMTGMDPQTKDTLLVIYAKASYIAPKLAKLFELTLEEKKALAKSIDAFAQFVDQKLNQFIPDNP